MTRRHKEFETLCALAAVERLSENDLQKLTDHCLGCGCCRRRLEEAEIVSQEYFLLFAAHSKGTTALPSGAHDRFVRRASTLGIPLSQASSKNSTNRYLQLPIGVFVVAVIALFLCRTLMASHDLPPDVHSNTLSNARSISSAPLHLITASAPVSASVSSPGKRKRTTEKLVLRRPQAKYRTQFQFLPQLRLTGAITIAKGPIVFELSHPVNRDSLRPIPGMTFALTSLPQLWPDDDPAPHDRHIAHFDLPALFPKSINKTQ